MGGGLRRIFIQKDSIFKNVEKLYSIQKILIFKNHKNMDGEKSAKKAAAFSPPL